MRGWLVYRHGPADSSSRAHIVTNRTRLEPLFVSMSLGDAIDAGQ